MKLTPLGAQVAQMGDKERKAHGAKIVGGENVGKYTGGICYEAALYVRFLLGNGIKPDEVVSLSGNACEKKLAFASGTLWDGKASITKGAAVGFFRLIDSKFFHAAISTGGSKIRAVNGNLLGNGWSEADLKKVLGPVDKDKAFEYDRTKIKVYISKV